MNFLDPRLPARFWDKVIPEPNSGCWLWLGCRDQKGYGQLKWRESGAQLTKAHRLTVAIVFDLMPAMTVDHRCENTSCVNPNHCQVVSRGDNVRLAFVRRGSGSALVDRCNAGHVLSDVGTVGNSNRCRVCFAKRMREYRARRKAS